MTVGPLDGDLAGSSSGRRRYQIDVACVPDVPIRFGSPASPNVPHLFLQAFDLRAFHVHAGRDVGARATDQEAEERSEIGPSPRTCNILEASVMTHDVHVPVCRAARRAPATAAIHSGEGG